MRRWAIWLLVALVCLWAGAFLYLKSTQDRATKEMVAVADRLSVPGTWQLTSQDVVGDKLICLDHEPCPSLYRTWQADRELAVEDLQDLAERAGWDMSLDDECARMSTSAALRDACAAIVLDAGYEIQLQLLTSEPGAASQLELRLVAAD